MALQITLVNRFIKIIFYPKGMKLLFVLNRFNRERGGWGFLEWGGGA